MSRFDWLVVLSIVMFFGSFVLFWISCEMEEASGIFAGLAGIGIGLVILLISMDAHDCATGRCRYELRDTGNGERHWQFIGVKKETK